MMKHAVIIEDADKAALEVPSPPRNQRPVCRGALELKPTGSHSEELRVSLNL